MRLLIYGYLMWEVLLLLLYIIKSLSYFTNFEL